MNQQTQVEAEAEAILILKKKYASRNKDYNLRLEYWSKNPYAYITERLGIRPEMIDWELNKSYEKHKWDGTHNPLKRILEFIALNKWVGVESAKNVGKTFLGACIVFWFLECFKNSIVVTTAPKRDQLSLHIWREIARLFPKFNKGELLTLKLRMNEDDTWLAVGFVAGVGASEESATKASGFHAEHMLIILEETPGIHDAIIKALQDTSTATHNIILSFGNPDSELDNLHKFCKQTHVEKIRISAFDHPNIVLNDPNFIPGAISSNGLDKMKTQYGIDNPLYLSRARGISPAASIDSLIRIEWIRAAQERFEQIDLSQLKGKKALGIDVANSESGDKAAIAEGIENVFLKVTDFQCPDANELGHRIYRMMKDENILPENVGIDGIGVGAGAVNTLKEYGIEKSLIDIQSAAKPVELNINETFNNLRSQMWWIAREDLRLNEIALPEDEDLIADLVAPKWKMLKNQIVVETKKDIKKRLGHSTNLGDAFVYWNWKRKIRAPLAASSSETESEVENKRELLSKRIGIK
jgi:hypothetical protein